ncbi:hypothetical protein [uncultured Shewanella sp.]|uniref:hypothetical protein n=1 Tax=uncultured Shewanella sp. TaxID=173975 RepID=UPI00263616F3|nr:hypothetical protein [uncultured Shewanella sp.]
MKTLTHLSVLSVLFFSVMAFASAGTILPMANEQIGLTQSVQGNGQCKYKMTLMSAKVNPQKMNKGYLTANVDQNGVKALLESDTDKQYFNQSQHDSFKSHPTKFDEQFANNMSRSDALVTDKIMSMTSFNQSQHDFSRPSDRLDATC